MMLDLEMLESALPYVEEASALTSEEQVLLVEFAHVHHHLMTHGVRVIEGDATAVPSIRNTSEGWDLIWNTHPELIFATWSPDLAKAAISLLMLLAMTLDDVADWDAINRRFFEKWLPSKLIREAYRQLLTERASEADMPLAEDMLRRMDGDGPAHDDVTAWARRLDGNGEHLD